MNKIRISLVAIISLFFMSAVNAEQTNYGVIKEIRASDLQAYIFVSNMGDVFGCTPGATGEVGEKARLYWATDQSDKLWSMLLAAQMSGKEVSFEGKCVSGLVSIETVYLRN